VGRHFIPEDISYFFLTVLLDSLGYSLYNVLRPIIGPGLRLAYTPTRETLPYQPVVYIYGYLYIARLATIPKPAFG